MGRFIFIILLTAFISCKGQDKDPSVKSALPERVISYYDKEDYDSIYFLFSHEFKKQLSLEKTKEFFTQLRKDAGKAGKVERHGIKGSAVRYKVDFANSVLWMDISENQYGRIDGLIFTPYDGPAGDELVRNKTKLSLPFAGEWYVFWGGDTKQQNYHIISKAQRYAFDLVIVDSFRKSYRTDGKTNEDFYAFGQPLLSPCNAKVISVTDGVDDNVPGVMNQEKITGNTVILQSNEAEFLLFAHFKKNSIKVQAGDSVRQGQLLGLCGNSGNSSEPHLHFHIQDKETMEGASGIKCFFENILVNAEFRKEHSPVRGERIRNQK